MSESVYYVTTPIYYVNGRPHIGSALTTVCCDALIRWQKMKGRKTWFLTGTDEQATKVFEAAEAAGISPQQFVDGLAADFRSAWDGLHIEYDDFIRTTEPRHVRAVQEFFRRLRDSGDVYTGLYEGWYCVSDETFFRDSEVAADLLCPNAECRKPLRRVQEENYFFKLSAYGDRLLEHIEKTPGFLQPEFRRNEVVSFIQQGLRDMSVTRANNGWGIPVPDEPDKVIYVWFDALINYLAATGWPDDETRYKQLWPANVHLVGKEIFVRFHATLWPCMLMALGVPLPETVYAHGWWVARKDESGHSQKLGKSTGGLPHPVEFAEEIAASTGADPEIAVDALRYLLLREMVFHGDSEYSHSGFYARYNSDLANDLGNLCNRTVNMVGRYFDGRIPARGVDSDIAELASKVASECDQALTEFRFNAALEAVWRLVGRMNRYIEEKAPWKLAKGGQTEELATALYTCLESVRVAAILVAPVMPVASARLLDQIGFGVSARGATGEADEDEVTAWESASLWGQLEPGTVLPAPQPIFPRYEAPKEMKPLSEATPAANIIKEGTSAPQSTDEPASATITIDDFMKVQLRVADIVSAEPVPNADKLLKLTVNLGDETRTILAGIAEMYQPDELVGRQVVVVANLQPRKMRGIESQGMLLAADVDGQAILLHPETKVPAGSRVR